ECHVVNARLVQANASGNDWGSAWLSRNSAGSGAFRLTQHDPAVGFVAERFADHFMGWGPRYLDVIEFRGVRDTNTRVLGLIRGDFHGMGGYLQADQLQRIRQSGRAQVLEHESTRIMMMQFMTQRAPLDNVHVRRAINMAFDYDGFNQGILGGTVERNPTPIPNPMWGTPKDVTGYRFDLDGARAELARSGVRIDRPLEIAFLVGFAQSEQAAQLLQNGLTRLGIQSRVVGYPWPTIVERFKDPNTTPDINVYWISTYYSDPHNWIGEMFHSANRGTFRNAHWYSNPELDAILDKAIRSDSREERQRLYEQAVRIVVADAPGLWIYNTKWYGPYSSRVRGISFNPINNGQEMRTVYFEG
ncbi:MAG: ABC transporter substrate-binding protein, partial [Thermomicrobium sp.]|nr:ABC transporter substrate-binding protein [Thermomicrobium sp.]